MSRPSPSIMKTVKQILSYIIVLGVFAYLIIEINNNWSSLSQIPWKENWIFLVLHMIGLFVMQGLMCLAWKNILAGHGVEFDTPSLMYSFYVPNLGKYLPGKVLFLAGRVELTHRLGGSRTIGLSVFIHEVILVSLAAAVFAPLCFSSLLNLSQLMVVIATLVILLVLYVFTLKPDFFVTLFNQLLERLGKASLESRLQSSLARKILLIYLINWFAYGASCALLVISVNDIGWDHFMMITAAFVVSWLIGFLSILTPGGLGVREVIIVLILGTIMDTSAAMLMAVIARLTWTIAELGVSTIALMMSPKFKE